MRFNDVGMVVMILGVGFVLGVLTTMAVTYSLHRSQVEQERLKARQQLEAVEQERDDARARINYYLDLVKAQREAAEQGTEEPGAKTKVRPAAEDNPQAP